MPSRSSQLNELNKLAEAGGGADKVQKHHEAGRLTARERIEALLDPGTFVEIDKLKIHDTEDFGMGERRHPGDGVVVGYGTVHGRNLFVYAQDFTVVGGTISLAHSEKICKLLDLATRVGAPVVALLDTAGARMHEGIGALVGYSQVLVRNVRASGIVPQIACVMGPCAGGFAYTAGIADLTFMVQGAGSLFLTRPEVVSAVYHNDVSKEVLGGTRAHAEKSGVVHAVLPDDATCLERVRELLAYLPQNNAEDPPGLELRDDPSRLTPELARLIPESLNKPYDVRTVIKAVVDDGELFELQELHAKNVIIGLARVNGQPVGIVANQPAHLAGCLDLDGSVKAARFVRFCDCYNIPLLTFVDAPGFLPGIEQEHGGVVHEGAKLLFAYVEASVPKVTLILRKAYGAAYVVMGSKHLFGDMNFALPTAEIAVLAPEQVVPVIHKAELDEDKTDRGRKQLVSDYREAEATPFRAAERGYVDEIIAPELARQRIARALAMLRDKRIPALPRKHSNMPL